MQFDILTIFPEITKSYIEDSILRNAISKDLITINFHDIRKYTDNKHKKVDDTPFGGGAGMVMMPQPIFDCVEDIKKTNKGPVIFMTPQGETFRQQKAEELSELSEMIILCGRYEGIDQRVRDQLIDMEISIGDYVLTGGELPAMILVDAISRLIPGVLGKPGSLEEESFSPALDRKREYPHYTQPSSFRNMKVPDVLLSGNHAKIDEWRKNNTK